jgi:hypothetical protein
MTHPTADTTTTAIARDPGSTLTVDWHECKYLAGKMATPNRPRSAFRNGMTNCLELRDADFHYSVIGRSGIAALVSGYADCRSLNDEVATSRSRDDWPRCHGIGWHYMTPQPH